VADDYQRFKGWVARQKAVVDRTNFTWQYYQWGPKQADPIFFLHGATGTAECFYNQFLCLCPKGYQLVAFNLPPYTSYGELLEGLEKFFALFKPKQIHLVGTSLGGYIAQCYAQYKPKQVASLVLCNTFCDTKYFADRSTSVSLYKYTPGLLLKKMLLASFPTCELEAKVADSIDFVVKNFDPLTQEEVASRMILNCTLGPLNAADLPISREKITLIDANDDVIINETLRDQLQVVYNGAHLGIIKSGGNFPYLSRPEDFNMHLEVHLRRLNYFRPGVDDEIPAKKVDGVYGVAGVTEDISTRTPDTKRHDKDTNKGKK